MLFQDSVYNISHNEIFFFRTEELGYHEELLNKENGLNAKRFLFQSCQNRKFGISLDQKMFWIPNNLFSKLSELGVESVAKVLLQENCFGADVETSLGCFWDSLGKHHYFTSRLK